MTRSIRALIVSVSGIAVVVAVLALRHSRVAASYGRLFSHSTWNVLEAVGFLFFVATIAVARAKDRTRHR